MVERLLMLGLRRVEGERESRWTFNVRNGDRLLRTRLVHGDRGGTAFAIGRVRKRHSHCRPKWWDPDRRTRWRGKADNGLGVGGNYRSGVDRPSR